jgi:hypothetical protein
MYAKTFTTNAKSQNKTPQKHAWTIKKTLVQFESSKSIDKLLTHITNEHNE